MTDIIQRAFNVGEVSEDYWNRNDLDWFNRSVRVCKNFIPTASGNLVNRQGLKFHRELGFKPKIFTVYNENTTFRWFIAIGNSSVVGNPSVVNFAAFPQYYQTEVLDGTFVSTTLVGSSIVKDFTTCPIDGNKFLSGILTLEGQNTSLYGSTPYSVYCENAFTITPLKHIAYNLVAPSITVTISGAATIPVYYQVSTVTSSGTESLPSLISSDTGDALTASNQAQITWNEPDYNGFPVSKYYIYRVESNVSRFVGDIPATASGSVKTFVDFKFDRDVNLSPVSTILETYNSKFIDINTVCIHQQRLIGAKNRSYFASRSGAPQSLYYGNPIQDSDAFFASIFDCKEILWIRSVGGNLMLFDTQGIWTVPGNANGTLTPATAGAKIRWSQTVKNTMPILFKQNVGFYTNNYDFISLFKNPNGADAFVSKNLSELTYKFTANEVVYHTGYSSGQQELIWITSNNSDSSRSCRTITINEDQVDFGWARHETDGKIIAVCKNVFIVERIVNGVVKYYMEYMDPRQNDRVNGVFLDSYNSYSSPGITVTGLEHLEGKTVYAMVDGLKQGPFTVTSGTITLNTTGNVVHVGLPYESLVTTHDLDLIGNQTLVRQPKITSAANVWFKNTASGQIRVNNDPWQDIKLRDEADGYSAVGLQSGLTEDIHMSTSWRREQTISVRQNEPLPMTITAIARSVRT